MRVYGAGVWVMTADAGAVQTPTKRGLEQRGLHEEGGFPDLPLGVPFSEKHWKSLMSRELRDRVEKVSGGAGEGEGFGETGGGEGRGGESERGVMGGRGV